MKYFYTFCLLLFFPFFCFLPISFSQNPNGVSAPEKNIYDIQNSFLYAKYLLKSGNFNSASVELERISFLEPENDSIKFLLIESYKKSGNYPIGLKKTEEHFSEISKMPENYSISYSQMLLFNNEFEKLGKFINISRNLSEKQKFLFELNTHLFKKEWKPALKFWNDSDSSLKNSFPNYSPLVLNAGSVKYKRPIIGAGLSSIIPGLGKIYTSDWIDGLLSFVTVGALSYQAYRGFSTKGQESVYGWIFGTLAFGFYSGNIYGSVKAVKKYNSVLDEQIFMQVEKEFNNFN